jgi:prophage DNA circulation protein
MRTRGDMGPQGVKMELEEIDLFGDAFGTIAHAFETIPDASETIGDAFGTIAHGFETITDAFETIADAFRTISDAFETIADAFETIADAFRTIPDGFGTISDVIDPIPEPEAVPRRGARSMPLTHAAPGCAFDGAGFTAETRAAPARASGLANQRRRPCRPGLANQRCRPCRPSDNRFRSA